MSYISAIGTSSSGLTAQRLRMDIIANNIANVNTTRTENGEPYRRKIVIFKPRPNGRGVRVARNGIQEDRVTPLKLKYEPGHPDAGPQGYVAMPNVNIVTEMVDLVDATRAYEANVTAINTGKSMANEALSIGRKV